jgi:DNA polymerase-3 subunit epsilon
MPRRITMYDPTFDEFLDNARKEATQWALGLLSRDPSTWIILDTETTGLGSRDEIVQIGAIDGSGNVLIDNTLVKPTIAIAADAQAIHGISNQIVASAPNVREIFHQVYEVTDEKLIVIYNADYDMRMFQQSAQALSYPTKWHYAKVECAMHMYAQWYGEWNDYRGSFKWQRLPSGDHSALGDCRATLELIHRMAKG